MLADVFGSFGVEVVEEFLVHSELVGWGSHGAKVVGSTLIAMGVVVAMSWV